MSFIFLFKKENVVLHNIRLKSKVPFATPKRFKQIKRKSEHFRLIKSTSGITN